MMQAIAFGLWQRALLIVGLGAVTVAVSEFWFYEVAEDVDSVLILLAYGFLGYLFLIVLQRYRVRSFAGFYVAGALLGFLIEGGPVPVVYSAPPITIVWTSLAWHTLITICIAWYAFKKVLTRGSVFRVVLFCLAFGIFLGFWNLYMWNGNEVGEELIFEWRPADAFVGQFLLGYLMFLGGHILLDRFYPRNVRFLGSEYLCLWVLFAAIAVLTAIASGLIVLFPVLPVLVLLCLVLLRFEARAAGADADAGTGTDAEKSIMGELYSEPVPLWRYGLTLIIPLCAIFTYDILVEARVELEMNVVVITTAGPISVGLFLWSAVAMLRK